jgi:hypothetical protein
MAGVTSRQVIKGDWHHRMFSQSLACMTADEAGTAGHKNPVHEISDAFRTSLAAAMASPGCGVGTNAKCLSQREFSIIISRLGAAFSI